MANGEMTRIKLADEEDAFLLFYNARAFHVSATTLGDLPQTDFYLWPSVVCEAFGLVLHLKCLLMLKKKPFGNIHEINDLFLKLDQSDQDLVRKKLEEMISIDPLLSQHRDEGTLEVDLETVLKRANKMFIRARYWHEGFTKEWLENDEMCTAGIYSLANAIAAIILEMRPDWTEEKMKSLKLHRKSYSQPPT